MPNQQCIKCGGYEKPLVPGGWIQTGGRWICQYCKQAGFGDIEIRKFITRPVGKLAVRLMEPNKPEEVAKWCNGRVCGVGDVGAKVWIEIDTLEGVMRADYGDWIVRGLKGEHYPCKPDIFYQTYTEEEKFDRQNREIVICAAVVAEDGRIFRGHRHNNCLALMAELKLHQRKDHEAQGFITSRNRYVDRKEGMKLQLAAGIKSADPAGYQGNELYSEDLY